MVILFRHNEKIQGIFKANSAYFIDRDYTCSTVLVSNKIKLRPITFKKWYIKVKDLL